MHPERKPQYQDNGYRMDQHSEAFRYNWPSSKEASISLHQKLERMMQNQDEMFTRMDTRMERIERSRMYRRDY